jgi:hypothetical protein
MVTTYFNRLPKIVKLTLATGFMVGAIIIGGCGDPAPATGTPPTDTGRPPIVKGIDVGPIHIDGGDIANAGKDACESQGYHVWDAQQQRCNELPH